MLGMIGLYGTSLPSSIFNFRLFTCVSSRVDFGVVGKIVGGESRVFVQLIWAALTVYERRRLCFCCGFHRSCQPKASHTGV